MLLVRTRQHHAHAIHVLGHEPALAPLNRQSVKLGQRLGADESHLRSGVQERTRLTQADLPATNNQCPLTFKEKVNGESLHAGASILLRSDGLLLREGRSRSQVEHRQFIPLRLRETFRHLLTQEGARLVINDQILPPGIAIVDNPGNGCATRLKGFKGEERVANRTQDSTRNKNDFPALLHDEVERGQRFCERDE